MHEVPALQVGYGTVLKPSPAHVAGTGPAAPPRGIWNPTPQRQRQPLVFEQEPHLLKASVDALTKVWGKQPKRGKERTAVVGLRARVPSKTVGETDPRTRKTT